MKNLFKNIAMGALLTLSASAQAAIIYSSPATNGAGNFTSYDTDTNVTTVIGGIDGNMGLTFSSDNTLYGLKQQNLYTIDINTGATTLIGSNSVSDFLEALTFGLDGKLYTADSGRLWTLDTTTGAETLLGTITGLSDVDGLTVAPTEVVTTVGTFAAGTLFANDGANIYALDLNTMTAIQVSNSAPSSESIAFDADGTLYTNASGFSTYDLLTGASTALGGNGIWGSAIYGALSQTSAPIPAPGTALLLSLGLFGLMASRRKVS